MAAPGENLRIDGGRLWDSIMEMAKIGPGVAGGNNRQTLTDADAEGRALFRRWCDAAGLTLGRRRDGDDVRGAGGRGPGGAAGVCRQPSRHPADRRQVRRRPGGARGAGGGALDERPRDPDAASGRRHQLDQRGGRALRAGDAGVRGLRRRHRPRLRLRADRSGREGVRRRSSSASAGRATRRSGARKMHAYFELHIEQGPILEAEGKEIGVVTHCQGLWWLEFTLTGKEAHTGSTPMDDARQRRAGDGADLRDGACGGDERAAGRGRRRRAGEVRAELAQRAAGQGGVHRRHPLAGPGKLDRMRARVEAEAAKICEGLGVGCSVEPVGHFDPVTFAPELVARVRGAAERLGYSHRDIVWRRPRRLLGGAGCAGDDGDVPLRRWAQPQRGRGDHAGVGGEGRQRAVPRGGGDGGDRGVSRGVRPPLEIAAGGETVRGATASTRASASLAAPRCWCTTIRRPRRTCMSMRARSRTGRLSCTLGGRQAGVTMDLGFAMRIVTEALAAGGRRRRPTDPTRWTASAARRPGAEAEGDAGRIGTRRSTRSAGIIRTNVGALA